MTSFDPYYDWSKVTDDHADDLKEFIQLLDDAKQDVLEHGDNEAAGEFLRVNAAMKDFYEEVLDEIFTVPVMVHVAGEKKIENHADEPDIEVTVQRCQRCASPLQMWHEGMMGMTAEGLKRFEENEVPWWDEDKIIAKATSPTGIGMYEVESDRELEDHERECVGLPSME